MEQQPHVREGERERERERKEKKNYNFGRSDLFMVEFRANTEGIFGACYFSQVTYEN